VEVHRCGVGLTMVEGGMRGSYSAVLYPNTNALRAEKLSRSFVYGKLEIDCIGFKDKKFDQKHILSISPLGNKFLSKFARKVDLFRAPCSGTMDVASKNNSSIGIFATPVPY
jgi:hypothetical protein